MAVQLTVNNNYFQTTGYPVAPISVSLWVYFNAVPSGGTFQNLLYFNAGTDIFLELTGASPRINLDGLVGTQVIAAATWYKVALVLNGASSRVYVVPGTTSSIGTGQSVSKTNPVSMTRLNYGAAGTGTTEGMNGRMANLKMWSGGTALTATELDVELNSYTVTRTANLLRAHKWITLGVVPDAGSGGNLSVLGTPTLVGDPPQLATVPPGEILDIGAGVDQQHFNVQVSRSGDVEPLFVSMADIEDGYDEPPYFTGAAGGTAVLFRAPVNGPGIGSTDPRCELREVNADGSDMGFDPFVGTHTIEGRFRVTHDPSTAANAGITCVQLHDGSSDALTIRTQLVSGTIRMRVRVNGTSNATQIASPYTVGTWTRYKIVVTDGVADFYWNATGGTLPGTANITGQAIDPTGSPSFYFKAGCYLQDPPTTTGEYGEVEHEYVTVTHEAPPFETVSPESIPATSTVGTPTIATGPVTRLPAAIASAAIVGAPQIVPGAVSRQPQTIGTTATVSAPAISAGSVTVSPSPLLAASTVSAPSVVLGPISTSPATINSALTVAAPTVTVGPISVGPAPIPGAATVGTPAVGAGPVSLNPVAISPTATVTAPTVTPGPVTVAPLVISSTAVVGEPTVSSGGHLLAPALVASSSSVLTPTITLGPVSVSLATVTSTSTVSAPAVVPGAVAIAPAAIGTTSTIGRPVVVELIQVIRLAAIVSTPVVYLPWVTVDGDGYPKPQAGQPIELAGLRAEVPPFGGVHAGTPTATDLHAGAPAVSDLRVGSPTSNDLRAGTP